MTFGRSTIRHVQIVAGMIVMTGIWPAQAPAQGAPVQASPPHVRQYSVRLYQAIWSE